MLSRVEHKNFFYKLVEFYGPVNTVKETIYMKCQILFSGRNKKKYFNMSSAKILPRLLSVKRVKVSKYLV